MISLFGTYFKLANFPVKISIFRRVGGSPKFNLYWNPSCFYFGTHAKLCLLCCLLPGRKERVSEEERKKRKKNDLYSGQLCLSQKPRAAHTLRSYQHSLFHQQNYNMVTVTGEYMHLRNPSGPDPELYIFLS